MEQRTCHINDACSTTGRLKRGLCSRHYQWAVKAGVIASYAAMPTPPRYCSVDACPALAKPGRQGMCNKHATRAYKYGDPNYVTPNPRRNGVEECSIEGCNHVSKAKLMCVKHYTRWFRHSDPEALGRLEQCIVCFSPFEKRTGKQVCCSTECRRERLLQYGRDYQTAWRAANPRPPVPTFPAKCWFCHTEFAGTKRRHRYCTNECFQAARGNQADYGSQRRKERLSKATIERFSRKSIFDRDQWICGLCREPIDPEETFPSGASASLDHIVPIARGGDHVPSNCQAAHLTCNCRKNDNLIFR